ncbi:unnamed protein product [Thelazia callipaeda]|uniref:Uncharacterized protein n=1 Tax=Thelazia callipaeda TaxID=103827 RepID=A0A0N5CS58_THECL|nr:unnamed protein product [Thelazia callipaeda]
MLSICTNKIWENSNKPVRCIAVSAIATQRNVTFTEGVLCCCRSTCMATDNDSYVQIDDGYLPFEM